jgi:hypothetical protein
MILNHKTLLEKKTTWFVVNVNLKHDSSEKRAIISGLFSKRYSNPITGPEGSRRLRLSDFKTIGK